MITSMAHSRGDCNKIQHLGLTTDAFVLQEARACFLPLPFLDSGFLVIL